MIEIPEVDKERIKCLEDELERGITYKTKEGWNFEKLEKFYMQYGGNAKFLPIVIKLKKETLKKELTKQDDISEIDKIIQKSLKNDKDIKIDEAIQQVTKSQIKGYDKSDWLDSQFVNNKEEGLEDCAYEDIYLAEGIDSARTLEELENMTHEVKVPEENNLKYLKREKTDFEKRQEKKGWRFITNFSNPDLAFHYVEYYEMLYDCAMLSIDAFDSKGNKKEGYIALYVIGNCKRPDFIDFDEWLKNKHGIDVLEADYKNE